VLQERCYYGRALNTGNESFCARIAAGRLLDACLERAGLNYTSDYALIEGQVFNKLTGEGYSGIDVEVYSTSYSERPISTDVTDSDGWYSVTVPPGDTYNIYVLIGPPNPMQTVEDTEKRVYIVDFILV
jgi:hypothetical protein